MENIPFPNKKYNIIYADPPWKLKAGSEWNTRGTSNGVSRNLVYPTMEIDEIINLPVKEIANKDCHLYLWTVNKYLKETFDVLNAWGFKFSCMLTWCKPKHGIGLGGTYIQTTEHLFFCRRGTLKAKKRVDTSWFAHKRLSHSTKPPFFRDMIVDTSGDLPRIELFSRKFTDGWDVWGNEV